MWSNTIIDARGAPKCGDKSVDLRAIRGFIGSRRGRPADPRIRTK